MLKTQYQCIFSSFSTHFFSHLRNITTVLITFAAIQNGNFYFLDSRELTSSVDIKHTNSNIMLTHLGSVYAKHTDSSHKAIVLQQIISVSYLRSCRFANINAMRIIFAPIPNAPRLNMTVASVTPPG